MDSRRVAAIILLITTGFLAELNPIGHSLSWARSQGGSSALTQKLIAAFVYQFTKYLEWKSPASSSKSDYVIQVWENSQLQERLSEITRGKQVDGRNIVVKPLNGDGALPGTRIVVLVSDQGSEPEPLIRRLKGCACAVVTFRDGAAEKGALFNFYVSDESLRFEINRHIATEQGIDVSSQLLKLGRIIE